MIVKLLKYSYIQVYNLHRSPYCWDRPNDFEPERFLVQNNNEEVEGWAGFDPSRSPGALYPNEVALATFHGVCVCVNVRLILEY